MKLLKKALKGIAIFAGLIIFVWLLYSDAKTFLKIDLSRDYLNVQGIEIEYSRVNRSDMSYESDE